MQASVALKPKSAGATVLVGGDVAVGEGDALGLAGGAGGVDEGGEVFGLDGADESVEDRVALRAADIGAVHAVS